MKINNTFYNIYSHFFRHNQLFLISISRPIDIGSGYLSDINKTYNKLYKYYIYK